MVSSVRFVGQKLMTIGAALSMTAGLAFAEDNNVSTNTIINSLKPIRMVTRRLSLDPREIEQKNREATLINSMRDRSTRSMSTDEREQLLSMTSNNPKIDLEINFDYDSADISAASLPNVQALGRALANPSLKGSTFVVAGYTDAMGGEQYNQDLSERRADAIKRYLVDKYSLPSTDLVTVGYGKSKLKDPSQPLADVNRRVQVVNMQNKETASK